jgi:hypothetical protein
MANALFYAYRNNMLGDNTFTNVQLDADTIKAMWLDHTDDTPVIATDQDLADLSTAARVPASSSCPSLASKTIGTVSAGTFDAANTTFTSLTGDVVESLVLFKSSTSAATSILLVYFDTFSAGQVPLTPNGGDVTVTWSTAGIFTV